MNAVELEKRFTRPGDLDPMTTGGSTSRLIRARALQLAFLINDVLPDGEEKEGAIRCLEDALAWVRMAARPNQ